MNRYRIREGQKVDLDDFDPDDTSLVPGGKAEAKGQLVAIVERLAGIQVSRDEQRRRLQARVDDPTKCWKFQHGDYPKCDLSNVVVE